MFFVNIRKIVFYKVLIGLEDVQRFNEVIVFECQGYFIFLMQLLWFWYCEFSSVFVVEEEESIEFESLCFKSVVDIYIQV